MSSTRLRPATPEDVSAVHVLEEELFGKDAWSEPAVHDELTGSSRQAVVAVDDSDSVIGYAVVLRMGEVADLLRIAVATTHRRRGVAGRLLAALDLSPYRRLLLEVRADNAAALAFYASLGFTEVARRRAYYADATDAVVMQRPG